MQIARISPCLVEALYRIIQPKLGYPLATITQDAMEALPSDDLIHEQATLVSRGVRPLALLGQCVAEEFTMVDVARHIASLAVAGVVPFVYDRRDGTADY